jgi:cytochrome c biogenesis protein CcmG, thiol:disulfide interchange protein DsbE
MPFLLGALVLLAPLAAGASKDRFEIGEEAPAFKLKIINPEASGGETALQVDQYWGAQATQPKKAVLLSFFATYCEPCKKEMPLLASLYDAYKDKGLGVVLVSIDTEEPKVQVAKELANKAGVKFPVLTDRFALVAKRYFIAKLPCVYVIDAAGKVTLVNIGYNDDGTKLLVEHIREQLGEPAGTPLPGAISKHMK